MQLQLVPASTGARWVKEGIRTFFKQPLALGGLFFMFMAIASVVSIFPFVGSVVALVIFPGVTLGLMVATMQASTGKFPMPSVLATAFRAGQQRLRSILILGVMYATGFLLVMGISSLVDGGAFAKLYLLGGKMNKELLEQSDLQTATLVAAVLHVPLSLMFWHAPALLHWHGVSPGKAIFFSLVACWRNKGAYLVFGLVWMGVFLLTGMAVVTVSAILGMPALAGALMLGAALVTAAMFFSSIYFTFRDSFVHESNSAATSEPQT